MKNLFRKDPIWFAVLWIVIYVVGFSAADGISESIGIPKLITVILGLVLSVILAGFIHREGLADYYGLCNIKVKAANLAYFIPLALISSVNIWYGLRANLPVATAILSVISMCIVALLRKSFSGGCCLRQCAGIILRPL